MAAVLGSLLAMGLAGEGLVRLAVPRSVWQFRDGTSDWQSDARLGWVQRPHLDVSTVEDFGWTVRFQTNGDGLTPGHAERRKQPRTVRVMVFGDSTVVGRAVPQEETIHAHLERLLTATLPDVEVINAGVQGYSTDQALIRMEQLVPLYAPDLVLYGLCDNDFGGITVDRAYGLNKPRFLQSEAGSLREVPPQPNERIGPFGTGARQWIQYSALYRLLRPRLTVLRAKLGRWEERNVIGLPPEFYHRPDDLERIDWNLFGALVRRMRECSSNQKAYFVFYAYPALPEVWNPFITQSTMALGLRPDHYDRYALENRLRRLAQETQTDFCPLVAYFSERQEQGPFHLLPRNPHCNPAGYRLTAEALAKHLKNRGPFAGGGAF